jgi:hypothetical protein
MAQVGSTRSLNAEPRIQSREESMRDLLWANWHWDGSSPITSGFLCQYHSARAPNSSSFHYYSYQKNKGE